MKPARSEYLVLRAPGLGISLLSSLVPVLVVLVLLNEAWTVSIWVDRHIPSGFDRGGPRLEDYPREKLLGWVFEYVPDTQLRIFAEQRFYSVLNSYARFFDVDISDLSWETVRLVLLDHLTTSHLVVLMERYVLQPKLVATFNGYEALFQRHRIENTLTDLRNNEAIKGQRVRELSRFWLDIFWNRDVAPYPDVEDFSLNSLVSWLVVLLLGFILALPLSIGLWLFLNEGDSKNRLRKHFITFLTLFRHPTTLVVGLGAVLLISGVLRPWFGAVLSSGAGLLFWYGLLSLVYAIVLIPAFVLENDLEDASQPSLLLTGMSLGLPRSYVMHFLVFPARFVNFIRRSLEAGSRTLTETSLFVILTDYVRISLFPDVTRLLPDGTYHLARLGLAKYRPLAAASALGFLLVVAAVQLILGFLVHRKIPQTWIDRY